MSGVGTTMEVGVSPTGEVGTDALDGPRGGPGPGVCGGPVRRAHIRVVGSVVRAMDGCRTSEHVSDRGPTEV